MTSFSLISAETQMMSSRLSLGLDDHLECFRLGCVPEGFVGIEDVVQLEAMRDEQLGIDLVRPQNAQQHRSADGVYQTRGDCDVAVPQAFQMQGYLGSVYPDVCNCASRRDYFFAQLERGRDTYSLDGGVDPAPTRHLHDGLDSIAVGTVDARGGAKTFRHFKTVAVEIDHDDFGG